MVCYFFGIVILVCEIGIFELDIGDGCLGFVFYYVDDEWLWKDGYDGKFV